MSKVITLRLDDSICSQVDAFARRQDWSRNKAISNLLVEGLAIHTDHGRVPLEWDVDEVVVRKIETTPDIAEVEVTSAVTSGTPTVKADIGAGDLPCEHPRPKQTKLATNRWQCECGAILQTNGRVIS